jgi:hypothetical protein
MILPKKIEMIHINLPIQLLMNDEIDAFIVKTFCRIQNGRTLQKVSDLHAGQTACRTIQPFPPQTKIMINLIWQSNATPNVLAYGHLSGPFDYNKMPLAPLGCEAQVHKKLTNAEHGHIIWSTNGISSHCQNIIAHTISISSTPRANGYLTGSNFNTNVSPIPPSHMPTK